LSFLGARKVDRGAEIAMNWLKRFMSDQSGATAIEYAIIAAGISVAIAAAVTSLGSQVQNKYTDVSNAFNTVNN
jgi:pilus assembly protein Flp/PilA